MATIERILKTVGKKTFIDCFEARQNSGFELNSNRVRSLCHPESESWTEGSLGTKRATVNRIFREIRQCEALRICSTARIPNEAKQKANDLYAQFCA